MNTVKTVLLLGVLSGLLLFLGDFFGGRDGLYIGLILAIGMNFFSYFFSDKIALATYSAQPVTPEQNSSVYVRVYPIVAGLAQRMGIPMPKLWLIPDSSPNAFATGRNPQHASVAFTAGILQTMNDDEIEGVVAHELGHVLHRDILISSVAATIASAVTFLARMGMFFGGGDRDDDRRGGGIGGLLMLILAPLAALLIQMAISRSRELDADSASARYTGNPHKLISALQKLDAYSRRQPLEATPATAHLFIIQPFTGESLMRLFSTHPSTAERVARLEQMS
ncbi:MAG: zinc metalloprotease HtpX [Acidobacteriaceae bacterium]|nr:zinc metalloprotease HtpX [Acidobacteriaceae bacterium]MBV9503089.1 zinc metalloprotease HtpX [Acidobacteriaceae bacterium]